ncbi:DOMON-like domain-containing protein [Qipengyuania sp. MTN3-11]|uniref:DOMON-like domain-containing protein n=1 Tax=Qipengyuania sp. MTN3-11 TaxID=3056557 RepID=UPI0036F29241
MQTHELLAHPAHPPVAIRRVEAKVIGRNHQWLRVRWRIDGVGKLVVPQFAGKGRQDGLWRTTCFELFLRPRGAEAYCEFNFSPSERWAAYDFDAVREGMRERAMPREPDCVIRLGQAMAIFDVAIPAAGVPTGVAAMNLAAVIEEEGGRLSYWALSHPDAEKPDFHDQSCFAAKLEAPRGP